MGWMFQNEPLRDETPASYVLRHFTHENDSVRRTVLAAATVSKVVYAAIRNEAKQTGHDYVFAVIILFENNRRQGFGYKDMSEGMGPCECDCPERIMRLLSPVEDIPNPSYSADWRARVAARKLARQQQKQSANRIGLGDIVRLDREIAFRGGVRAQAFRLIDQRKRTRVFEPLNHPGMRCRLPSRLIAGGAVERPATAGTPA